MARRRILRTLIVCLTALLPLTAAGQTTSVNGRWQGTYTCGQGLTGLTLVVIEQPQGQATGVFHFYADPSNPNVPTGCFAMAGTFDRSTGQLHLLGDHWIIQPPGYEMVGLDGQLNGTGGGLGGTVAHPYCSTFTLTRAVTAWSAPDACRAEAGKYGSL